MVLVEPLEAVQIAAEAAGRVREARDEGGHVVGLVGVAERERDPAITAVGARLVDHDVAQLVAGERIDQVAVLIELPTHVLGVRQLLALPVGDLAVGLALGQVVDVGVHRRTVRLVAVAGRDAVGVAHQAGVLGGERLALGAGEACPPGGHRLGVVADAMELRTQRSDVRTVRRVSGLAALAQRVDPLQCGDEVGLGAVVVAHPGGDVAGHLRGSGTQRRRALTERLLLGVVGRGLDLAHQLGAVGVDADPLALHPRAPQRERTDLLLEPVRRAHGDVQGGARVIEAYDETRQGMVLRVTRLALPSGLRPAGQQTLGVLHIDRDRAQVGGERLDALRGRFESLEAGDVRRHLDLSAHGPQYSRTGAAWTA